MKQILGSAAGRGLEIFIVSGRGELLSAGFLCAVCRGAEQAESGGLFTAPCLCKCHKCSVHVTI